MNFTADLNMHMDGVFQHTTHAHYNGLASVSVHGYSHKVLPDQFSP